MQRFHLRKSQQTKGEIKIFRGDKNELDFFA